MPKPNTTTPNLTLTPISYHPLWTPTMDWFSWLSRTTLDPSLIYDYGLTFARNELRLEDAAYFNHDLLQSMGISIAKHRLEILKLANKDRAQFRPKNLSAVIKKCLRKCITRFASHSHLNHAIDKPKPESQPQPQQLAPNWEQGKWKEATIVKEESDNKPIKVPMYRSKTIALSGPLDGTRMMHQRAMKLSGPLDGKMHERMTVYTNRSPIKSGRPLDGRFAKGPRFSGPLDARVMAENKSPRLPILRHSDANRAETESPLGFSPKVEFDFDIDDDDHTLWPTLFQDLKPT